MGPTLRCERVDIDITTIKMEEFISFEGLIFKRAERREEKRGSETAGINSFINEETGGLAVFMTSEINGSTTVINGKITMNAAGPGNFFLLESCGKDCGVLTQLDKRPKVMPSIKQNCILCPS